MSPQQVIGRERELATLLSRVDQAEDGRGSVVLLAGEAGLGKTLLTRQALSQRPHPVYAGRARLEVVTPYGPIASALRARLRADRSVGEPEPPPSPFLSLLLPELGPGPPDVGPEVLVEAILEAVLHPAKKHTVILLLEDLQWADNATLELIPVIAERIAELRMLVVATYRSDEIGRGHPVRRMRQELRRSRLLDEVVLEALERQDTGRLLERSLGTPASDELVDLVQRHTQGVPLYIEELAAALQASHRLRTDESGNAALGGEDIPVPESVRDSILLRLDALSEAARRILEVAALVGLEFDLELAASLADSEAGVEELLDHHLIQELEPGKGVFRHALIREVIRNDIAWTQRRALSRRIATFLERQGAAPELVAEHWLTARELEPACSALLQVADRSCRLHAYQDAAAAAHRALENWPESFDESKRLDALLRLAHCAQVGGQLGDAVRALREASGSPALHEDAALSAIILRDLATLHGLQGSRDKALEAHRDAAQAFERTERYADASSEYLAVAGSQTAASALEAALLTLQQAESLAQRAARRDLVVRARGFAGNVMAMLGRFEAGRQLAQEALSLALEAGENEAAAEAYRRLASVLDYGSDFAGSRDAYATAVDYCRTHGDAPNMTACLGCMSAIVYRTGEWKRALEIVKELGGNKDTPLGSRAIGHAIKGLIQANRGEVRAARRSLQSSLALLQGQDSTIVALMCHFGAALLAEFDGDLEGAARLHEQVLEGWRGTQDQHDLVPVFLWQSSFFGRIGDGTATTQRAEALTHMASGSGNRENIAALAHALGEVALLAGEIDKALEHFAQSLRDVDTLEIPLERAITAWRHGVALAHAGQRNAAADTLQAAMRLLGRLGARPLAALVQQEHDRLVGATPQEQAAPRRARDPGATLTPRQIEIVRLLAVGFTNKEIAARLFLSSRTVDMHVGNILERLDCAGRTEAARKAAQLGLLQPDDGPNHK